jgi:hypothetical protein
MACQSGVFGRYWPVSNSRSANPSDAAVNADGIGVYTDAAAASVDANDGVLGGDGSGDTTSDDTVVARRQPPIDHLPKSSDRQRSGRTRTRISGAVRRLSSVAAR